MENTQKKTRKHLAPASERFGQFIDLLFKGPDEKKPVTVAELCDKCHISQTTGTALKAAGLLESSGTYWIVDEKLFNLPKREAVALTRVSVTEYTRKQYQARKAKEETNRLRIEKDRERLERDESPTAPIARHKDLFNQNGGTPPAPKLPPRKFALPGQEATELQFIITDPVLIGTLEKAATLYRASTRTIVEDCIRFYFGIEAN